MSQRCNPLQQAFYSNQDVFNIMFTWDDRFRVFVFKLDGTVQTLNGDDINLVVGELENPARPVDIGTTATESVADVGDIKKPRADWPRARCGIPGGRPSGAGAQ